MMDRLTISPRLQSLMAYPKFAEATPRILFLRSDYWIDRACINAARSLGWEWDESRVLLEGSMPRELIRQLLEKVTEFRPDFIFTVNLSGMDSGGLFAGLFNDLAIPYAAWFVDDPRTILMGRTVYGGDYAAAFTWERAYLPSLTACGFGAAHYLPLAVDPSIFNHAPLAESPLPPTFVGSSMVRFAEREWRWFDDHPVLKAHLEDAFDQGQVTRQRFALGPAGFLPPEHVAALDAEGLRHAELIAFIEGTRRLRKEFVTGLAAVAPLSIRGDSDWAAYGVAVGGPADYENEVPQIYREASVNLNITSIQMATAVNQRVFDCPAAGGFLLTDRQADLEELFDVEREIACFEGPGEGGAALIHYLSEPLLRREITERARRRVLGEHTYVHRLQAMVALLKSRYAG